MIKSRRRFGRNVNFYASLELEECCVILTLRQHLKKICYQPDVKGNSGVKNLTKIANIARRDNRFA